MEVYLYKNKESLDWLFNHIKSGGCLSLYDVGDVCGYLKTVTINDSEIELEYELYFPHLIGEEKDGE